MTEFLRHTRNKMGHSGVAFPVTSWQVLKNTAWWTYGQMRENDLPIWSLRDRLGSSYTCTSQRGKNAWTWFWRIVINSSLPTWKWRRCRKTSRKRTWLRCCTRENIVQYWIYAERNAFFALCTLHCYMSRTTSFEHAIIDHEKILRHVAVNSKQALLYGTLPAIRQTGLQRGDLGYTVHALSSHVIYESSFMTTAAEYVNVHLKSCWRTWTARQALNIYESFIS